MSNMSPLPDRKWIRSWHTWVWRIGASSSRRPSVALVPTRLSFRHRMGQEVRLKKGSSRRTFLHDQLLVRQGLVASPLACATRRSHEPVHRACPHAHQLPIRVYRP